MLFRSSQQKSFAQLLGPEGSDRDPGGMWEPTYDPNAWAAKHELHLFVQNVGQGDAESLEELPPQMISVLEWKPKRGKAH